MRTIFLFAGHHNKDTGAVANGYVEAELTKELRDLTLGYLIKYPNNKIAKDSDHVDLSTLVRAVSKLSKEEDIICDIHFNCADSPNATGTEVFIPDRSTDKEREIAKQLCNHISSILGISNRGVKRESESARGRLAIMSPAGSNVLIEVCFISNKNDMDKYESKKEVVASIISSVLIGS